MAKQLRGPQGPAPATNGPINAVVCPFCGKTNDYRVLQEQQLMDTGHEVECDHCHYISEIAAIRQVTIVTVRPSQNRQTRAPAQQVVQQARTISPAQAARLLGQTPRRRR